MIQPSFAFVSFPRNVLLFRMCTNCILYMFYDTHKGMWQQFQRLLVVRVVVRWRIVQFSLPQCKKRILVPEHQLGSVWCWPDVTDDEADYTHSRVGFYKVVSFEILLWNAGSSFFFDEKEVASCNVKPTDAISLVFFFREIPPFRNQHVNEPFPLRSRVDFVRKKNTCPGEEKHIFHFHSCFPGTGHGNAFDGCRFRCWVGWFSVNLPFASQP